MTDDEIARRAYELYEAGGRVHGHDLDDWLQAERDLRGGVTDRETFTVARVQRSHPEGPGSSVSDGASA
jgi:hypothetical protein